MSDRVTLDFGNDMPKLMVGLSWDPNEESTSVLGDVTPHNADLICAVLDKNLRVLDVITPQNPKRDIYKDQIFHKGDSLSGAADFEDEEVIINFDILDDSVHSLAFAVGAHHSVKFTEFKRADIAFKNLNNLQDFSQIPFSELAVNATSIAQKKTRYVLAAYIHRDNDNQWFIEKHIRPMDNIAPETFEVLLKG